MDADRHIIYFVHMKLKVTRILNNWFQNCVRPYAILET